jgi:hypothetical protein
LPHPFGRSLAAEKDDDQERRGRLLLLGKGAVLAHRLARPLAAKLDDQRQRGEEPEHAQPRLLL